jgi:glycosyltransferase involved in cell wall biosynthesis
MLAVPLSREAIPATSDLLATQVGEVTRPQRRLSTATRQIIFINRFFYPDHSATSQLLTDLTFHMARHGQPVHVITSRQRYDNPRAGLEKRESVEGVDIHRVSTTQFGRAALVGRGFDYLSFYASVWRSILQVARAGDILVAKTDPPLLSIPALRAVRRRGLHLVNWSQDLYPEVAMALDVPLVRGPIAKGLQHLRDTTLRAASANVVVGERMAEIVHSRGIAAPVHVIPNWCDDDHIQPVAPRDNPLRRKWGVEGRFVVGYSGNLGRSHEFETVLDAAEHLRSQQNILFLFIGGGHQFDELARRVHERKLDSAFRFLPYQDRAALAHSLSVPDVHWISLRPELEGLIVPSKVYGVAAAGRPIISITARDGEIARLVQRHRCGIVVEPGAGHLLAEVLRRLSADPSALAEMGRRARAMLEKHFTRQQAFARWDQLFSTIV